MANTDGAMFNWLVTVFVSSCTQKNLYLDGKNTRQTFLAPHDVRFQLGQGPRRDSFLATLARGTSPNSYRGARMLRRETLTKLYHQAVGNRCKESNDRTLCK